MIQSLSSLEEDQGFDVVVVGAGMVGASTALGLAKSGLSVLMVEAFPLQDPLPEYTPSYDARSTALAWGSREIFAQLGVWDDICLHAYPIKTVHVSQKGRFGTTKMTAEEMQHDALGYVVPNQWLGQCLLASASEENIVICAASKVIGVSPQMEGHVISIASEGTNKSVHTNLLVIADGNQSETAKQLGIGQVKRDYGQYALIANVTTELPNQGVAYERFTPEGPLALLPLDNNQSALVWTHDVDRIDKVKALSDREFCLAIEDQFGDRMGRIVKCGERVSYPLSLIQAEEQTRSGVVLLGNAAHSLHPVAGQGFNLALRDVAVLLSCLSEFEDLNAALKAYFERQSFDQKRTITGSDQLVKVFGHSSILLSFARDLGLVGLNNLPSVKSAFAKTAMGLAGKKISLSDA